MRTPCEEEAVEQRKHRLLALWRYARIYIVIAIILGCGLRIPAIVSKADKEHKENARRIDQVSQLSSDGKRLGMRYCKAYWGGLEATGWVAVYAFRNGDRYDKRHCGKGGNTLILKISNDRYVVYNQLKDMVVKDHYVQGEFIGYSNHFHYASITGQELESEIER